MFSRNEHRVTVPNCSNQLVESIIQYHSTNNSDKLQSIQLHTLNYGCIIHKLIINDTIDTVIGYDSVIAYTDSKSMQNFNSVVGRYANRIRHGRFELDQKQYQLEQNNDTNHLHGGNVSFGNQFYDHLVIESTDCVILQYQRISRDGENEYPGEIEITVRYTLHSNGSLNMSYTAQHTPASKSNTIINLTNHTYWNLDGVHDINTIHDHTLKLYTDQVLAVDNTLIPTGTIDNVTSNSVLDFTQPRRLGERIDELKTDQYQHMNGYDHCYVNDDIYNKHITTRGIDKHQSIIVSILIFNLVETLNFAGPLECWSLAAQYIQPQLVDNKPHITVQLVACYTADDSNTEQMRHKQIYTEGNMCVTANVTVDELQYTDILIVPGGTGTRAFLQPNNQQLQQQITRLYHTATLVYTVCTGSLILAKYGLLQSNQSYKTHDTCNGLLGELARQHNTNINMVEDADVRFIDNGTKLITSGGISAGIDCTYYIIEMIYSTHLIQQIRDAMKYQGSVGTSIIYPNTLSRGINAKQTHIATLSNANHSLSMDVYTDQVGMQLYCGNWLNISKGKYNQQYSEHTAVCLETQAFPDSINNKQWRNNVILHVADKYTHTTTHVFTVY